METKMPNKKTKLIHNSHDDDVSQLSGHALKLIALCLAPPDILNCVQTCQQWKREIDEELWAAVAKAMFPIAVSAIEAAEVRHNFKLDYRNKVLCLSRKCYLHCKNRDKKFSSQPQPFREDTRPQLHLDDAKPKLCLEDILAVVEMRDKKTKRIVGAWSSHLTHRCVYGNDVFQFNFDNTNDFKISISKHELMDEIRPGNGFRPGCHVPFFILENLEMVSRFICLDSGNKLYGKCICLNDFMETCSHYIVKPNNVSRLVYERFAELKPTATTRSGAIATELCKDKDYNNISCDLLIDMVLEKSNLNQGQREWIEHVDKLARDFWDDVWRVGREDAVQPEWPELNECDRKKNFDYIFKSLILEIRVETSNGFERINFKSADDALLFLEGLDWK